MRSLATLGWSTASPWFARFTAEITSSDGARFTTYRSPRLEHLEHVPLAVVHREGDDLDLGCDSRIRRVASNPRARACRCP